MTTKNNRAAFFVLLILAILFLLPVAVVVMNSFKSQFYISTEPFKFPTTENGLFAGALNYTNGIAKTGFFKAAFYSVFITGGSVAAIVLLSAMTGWYITRVKTIFSRIVYFSLVFSIIVPFQMVMFPVSKIANVLGLDNPIGIIIIYIGFGAGLSAFMFCGFIKSIPYEIEEAAMIDGCGPIRTFFSVVFPMLKPTVITVAILNTMWIWNDYLLPLLIIGSDYRTIPLAIQYLRGGYGAVDMGAMMAMLVLAIIPIVVFYLTCQKHIIKGVAAGAVKG